jgi:hypothetical protein
MPETLRPRILLVDDDAGVLAALRRHYEVTATSDA